MEQNKFLNKMVSVSIVSTLLISIINILISGILLYFDYTVSIIFDVIVLDSVGKYFFYTFYLVCTFFSFNIFFLSASILTFIFYSLNIKIKKFSDSFIKQNSYIGNNKNLLVEISERYLELKNEYENSINLLNYVFSLTLILGGICTYKILIGISKNNHYIISYLYTISFIIILSIYIYNIVNMRLAINKFTQYVYTPSFLRKFVTKNEMNITNSDILELIKNENIGDTNNSNSQDSLNWMVLMNLLSTKWETFNILGFEFDDLAYIQKGISLILLYYFALEITTIFG
jgi:hypothetical protein